MASTELIRISTKLKSAMQSILSIKWNYESKLLKMVKGSMENILSCDNKQRYKILTILKKLLEDSTRS